MAFKREQEVCRLCWLDMPEKDRDYFLERRKADLLVARRIKYQKSRASLPSTQNSQQ